MADRAYRIILTFITPWRRPPGWHGFKWTGRVEPLANGRYRFFYTYRGRWTSGTAATFDEACRVIGASIIPGKKWNVKRLKVI